MKLVEMPLAKFIDLMASKEPAPGGGSAAAAIAACGAALAHMVAQLTIGKKLYAAHDSIMRDIAVESSTLQGKLLACIDKDTEAFNGVAAVFKMPKESDSDKAARTQAMQDALKAAAAVPLEVMGYCLDTVKIVRIAVGTSNTSAASDLGVAALSLSAAVKSAWLNVKINIGSIKDTEFVHEYEDAGSKLLEETEIIASKVYGDILASL